jgi:16S rRNA (cytosine1402-N4)-methyltransferase
MEYHNPVLLKETVAGLNIKPEGIYVDVTFGGGGHSKEIMKHLGPNGKLFGFDQDTDALVNTIVDERFVLINENFRFIKRFLRFHGVKQVDGILGDFGVSSHQFDVADRGFSFRFDEADLDMRMLALDNTHNPSAAHILNTYTEEQISDILFQYGELHNARSLAASICHYRSGQPIQKVLHLKEAIQKQTPKFGDYKFYAQVFQALRIAVNREMEVLKAFLQQVPQILAPQGRLVVMSYHSLEDRLVKNFIASGQFSGELDKDFFGNVKKPLTAVNRKVMVANEAELAINPRARSAKLRIAEKK